MRLVVLSLCLFACSEPPGGVQCPPATVTMACPPIFQDVTCPTTLPTCPPNDSPLLGAAPRVLIFSRQTFWQHPSNCVAAQNLTVCGMARGWTVNSTSDPSVFTDANLANYDVVVFAVTSGTVFDDDDQRMAFQKFIERGKGFAGTHSASFTEVDWDWFKQLVGATFRDHPPGHLLPAQLMIEDREDASTRQIDAPWVHCEELYTWQVNPVENPAIHVLVSLDENCPAYPDEMRIGHHPISWRHEFDGGRSFYTAIGHHQNAYYEPAVLSHVLAGIEWAGGAR